MAVSYEVLSMKKTANTNNNVFEGNSFLVSALVVLGVIAPFFCHIGFAFDYAPLNAAIIGAVLLLWLPAVLIFSGVLCLMSKWPAPVVSKV